MNGTKEKGTLGEKESSAASIVPTRAPVTRLKKDNNGSHTATTTTTNRAPPPPASSPPPSFNPPVTTTVASSPRLYVGNLHPRVTAVHLESLLQTRSLGVLQVQFPNSDIKSFCFVTLASTADATRAIQLLHGRKLMGRSLVVQPAHNPHTATSAQSSSSPSTIATTGKRERRQLDDQIQAIRQKLKEKGA